MPRKNREWGRLSRSPGSASMRPRPDAAEKLRMLGLESVAKRWASMRPRPDAAEKRARAARATGSYSMLQ